MARPHFITPLQFKPSRLTGLSERLLASHYENNYGGAVRRLNAIEAELEQLAPDTAPVFVVNGLKREQLIAANSMILHEVYFEGLGGRDGDAAGALGAAIERDFGSVDRWRREFVAMGKAQAGGSGWVLLTASRRDGRLMNQWAADHTNCLAAGVPVLALDMYEHAYHIDFGARAAAYVDAFMGNIHWERINARYSALAPQLGIPQSVAGRVVPDADVAVHELRGALREPAAPIVVDVRLAEDYDAAADVLPGALRGDPKRIDAWSSAALDRSRPVVVYCVYGFDVSRNAAAELSRRGFDARVLAGGIAAWRASGAPTVPRPGVS